jgi:hypothetical protein
MMSYMKCDATWSGRNISGRFESKPVPAGMRVFA